MNSSANLTYVTVDDFYPDPHTGYSILFGDGNWNIGQFCLECTARPDPTQTHRNTWHDTTFNQEDRREDFIATATFNFTGMIQYYVSLFFVIRKL